MRILSSSSHPSLKSIVRLQTAQERKRTGLCIIEGQRALTTALEGGLALKELYCTEEQLTKAEQLVPVEFITRISTAGMNKISSATTPSGLLGVFSIPSSPHSSMLTPGLVLAQIADPGNMGTLLRTAVACGVRSVVVIEGADPWSPKVLQASAGTVASLQIFQWSWQELLLAKGSLKLYGLIVEGGHSPHSIDAAQALIVVGNEARGIPAPWLSSCDATITLSMPGNTESLNAAIAGSIALYLTFVDR